MYVLSKAVIVLHLWSRVVVTGITAFQTLRVGLYSHCPLPHTALVTMTGPMDGM